MPTDAPDALPVTAAVNEITLPEGWTIHKVTALVRDLAVNMYDLPVILKKHGLTQAQHDLLSKNEFFQRALESSTIEWNAPQSAHKRLALASSTGIEDALPTLVARLSRTDEPLSGVVPLLKVLAEMSGAVGQAKALPTANEKFKITINLGGDSIKFDKKKPILEIQPFGEGAGEGPQVRSISEGTGETL